MHILCTICSDLINQAENIFGTNCGHIFHHHCLSQWIARSKTCPQCRNKVTEKGMFRIYPTISSDKTEEDATTLQARLDNTQLQLREQNNAYKLLDKKATLLTEELNKQEELVRASAKRLVSRESAVCALKKQLEYLKVQNKETERLRDENEQLQKNMQTLKGLQVILRASSAEAEEMVAGYGDLRTLATFAVALKRALCAAEASKKESRAELAVVRSERVVLARKLRKLQNMYYELKKKYDAIKNDTIQNQKIEILEQHPEVNVENESQRANQPTEGTEREGEAEVPRRKRARAVVAAAALLDTTASSLDGEEDCSSLLRADLARLKPTEYRLVSSGPAGTNFRYSIFPGLRQEEARVGAGGASVGLAPDGLGGRARPDPAPTPARPAFPAPGPRHRLRRPATVKPTPTPTSTLDKWLH